MSPLPARANFRDLSHYLAAVGSELAGPLLRLAARSLSRGAPTPPSEWRRALIVGHGHIGDVLYQTVSLDSLARGLPNCEFDYLTTPLGGEVLAGNPALSGVLPWSDLPDACSVTEGHFPTLRNTEYDAIVCTNLVRHQDGLRLGLRLGIPNRVAFTHRGLSGLTTLPVRVVHPMTPAHQSRVMMQAITGAEDRSELRPHIFLNDDDRLCAEREWTRLGLLPSDSVLASSITTRQTLGGIKPQFFTRILAAVAERQPSMRIVLCGSAADEPALRAAATHFPGTIAISCGQMSLRTYAAFLARCKIFFGMDSGPRHLANAVGIPVVFVRNMAVRAAEAAAYCPTEIDIAPGGDFRAPKQIVASLAKIDSGEAAATILAAGHFTNWPVLDPAIPVWD